MTPGDLTNRAQALSNKEHSLVYALKQIVQLQNERTALYTALRLDPDQDSLEDAVALCEALWASYEAISG